MKISLFVLAASLVSGSLAQAQPASEKKPILIVSGSIDKPHTWTLAELKKLAPVETIKTTLKGKPYEARGIKLWPLIQAAAPTQVPKVKHPEARFVVVVRGNDGYMASFALPELMPDVGNKNVYLTWEANGKPLAAKEGMLRLVVPGEKKPMRWVYNLLSVEIEDGQRLSSQPTLMKR